MRFLLPIALLTLLACGGTVDPSAAPDAGQDASCAPGYVVACASPGHYEACVAGELVASPCASGIAVCDFTTGCAGAAPVPDAATDAGACHATYGTWCDQDAESDAAGCWYWSPPGCGAVDAGCWRCVAAGWVDTCAQVAAPDSESCLYCGILCDSGDSGAD